VKIIKMFMLFLVAFVLFSTVLLGTSASAASYFDYMAISRTHWCENPSGGYPNALSKCDGSCFGFTFNGQYSYCGEFSCMYAVPGEVVVIPGEPPFVPCTFRVMYANCRLDETINI
jgi:hypothetical protein